MPVLNGVVSRFDDEAFQFVVNCKLYGTGAIFKTCYAFMGNCYVYLDFEDDDHIKVIIKQKEGKHLPPNFAEEFLNELVNQRLRVDINLETGKIREMLIAKALFTLDIHENSSESSDDFNVDILKINQLKGI